MMPVNAAVASLLQPLLSLALPYVALLATSLSRAWGNGPVPGNLTLDWYGWAFQNDSALRAIYAQPYVRGGRGDDRPHSRCILRVPAARRLLPGASLLTSIATRFQPIAYSGSEAALRALDVDLENAARTLGCSGLRRFGPGLPRQPAAASDAGSPAASQTHAADELAAGV